MVNNENKFIRFLLLVIGCLVACLILFSFLTRKGTEVIWINRQHNYFLDGFFYLITSLGNGFVVIPLLVTGLISKMRLTLIAGIAFSVLGIICSFLKSFFDLPRPTVVLDDSMFHFVPGVMVHSHYSFPSGHTATVFCVAVLASLHIKSKRLSLVLISIALLVGLSRIYLLQHFLIDVAAGAVLGSGIGFLAWHLGQKINLPWLDQGLNASIGNSKTSRNEENPPFTTIQG